ncbi:hypothetical protein Trco_004765 [Trichoderma cornu-damae]|uniref:Uncharacterized protein n=1 Tax=Trichoderma cornu-damae TaxID=654480 RepID=A0A9P8QN88_9HYPO|nr:hypothetical protein Trco_004765 [Trichoderma cornu-damae]
MFIYTQGSLVTIETRGQDLGHASNFGGRRAISHLHHALGEAPRAILAGDGVLHGGRDGSLDAQPAEAVLADGLCVAEAAEALLAGEAAVARAGDAAKGELDGVVGGEVVDGDHAGLEAADDGPQGGIALGAVDGGAEAEVGGVGDGEHVLRRGGLGAEHGEDRGETLLLGDAHGGRHVDEEGGLEVVAPGVVGVKVASAAGEQTGALGHGFRDELLEAGEGGVGDHGPHVGVGAEADGPDARLQELDEAVVDGAGRDDSLDADAVLAGGLKGAPEDDVDDARQVAVPPAAGGLEHDEGVLAAQLGDNGGQAPGGAGGNVVGDGLGADEGDVADAGVRRQVAGGLRPANHRLDNLRVVAVGSEGAAGDAEEVGARPGRLLGHLDQDGVAGEEGADDGAHQVVEGVVPADQRGDHAERLVIFVGLRDGRRASSPCASVHWIFSTVTRISPSWASTMVLPLSRQATVQICSALSMTCFISDRSTAFRCANVVPAHAFCAAAAAATARSMPSAAVGSTSPRNRPVAGA